MAKADRPFGLGAGLGGQGGRAGNAGLRLALAAPVLAAAFACVFDGVMLVTTWQQLGQDAAALAEAAARTPAATEATFARAAAHAPGGTGAALALRRLGPVGETVREWRHGDVRPALPPPMPPGCRAAFVADLAVPPPDFLLGAALVRGVLPGLRARAVACVGQAGVSG